MENNNVENELLIKLRGGSMTALSDLYDKYHQPLMAFVMRTAKLDVLAEDIVHDTFIRLWEKRDRLDVNMPVRPYLFTIARRLLLNTLRRLQHESAIIEELRNRVPAIMRGTDDQLDYKESESLLKEAIDKLPDRCRDVFVSCFVSGSAYRETAGKLGISENTVSNQMVKAMKMVRQYIRTKNGLTLFFYFILTI